MVSARAGDAFDCGESSCSPSLLQAGLTVGRPSKDLVLMHIPYNFGHTLEFVAFLPTPALDALANPEGGSGGKGPSSLDSMVESTTLSDMETYKKPGGEVWGHLNPELHAISNVTGCPMYYTPPKYWPSDLAERYFANKQVFGLFRNPYERLVAFFRGNMAGYGGNYGELHDRCDVNAAVKLMMKKYIDGDKFADGCTFLPQTEYTDMPHGVTIPIDLHAFPNSMNDVLSQHGYDEMHIRIQDIQHVRSCDNFWAGDLDNETRALVKHVYKRDFEFLCSTFGGGYCDQDEPMCLQGIPYMCPEKAFTWDETKQRYQRRTV